MLKVGLTGGIGSGKSTAADFFRQQGIEVIDLDQIARQVVEPGSPALDHISEHFGADILTNSGALDRQKLGSIIFNDASEKYWLEALLHPLINLEMEKRVANSTSAYVVIEIPLLAENGRHKDVDRVLVIDAEQQTQLERAKAREAQSEDQIKKIIGLQASRQDRNALADEIVDNHGSLAELHQKLESIHKMYLKLSREPLINVCEAVSARQKSAKKRSL